jgi:hypothetical protein
VAGAVGLVRAACASSSVSGGAGAGGGAVPSTGTPAGAHATFETWFEGALEQLQNALMTGTGAG